jgi:hypothetical protein
MQLVGKRLMVTFGQILVGYLDAHAGRKPNESYPKAYTVVLMVIGLFGAVVCKCACVYDSFLFVYRSGVILGRASAGISTAHQKASENL